MGNCVYIAVLCQISSSISCDVEVFAYKIFTLIQLLVIKRDEMLLKYLVYKKVSLALRYHYLNEKYYVLMEVMCGFVYGNVLLITKIKYL